MPGDKGDMPPQIEAAVGFEHADHREAHRHQRGLCVFSQGQIALRPLEHQPRELLRQRLVNLVEEVAGRRKRLGEAAPHADRLRALTRKHQCTLHPEPVPQTLRPGIGLQRRPPSCLARGLLYSARRTLAG